MPVAIHGTYKSDDGKRQINIVNNEQGAKIASRRNVIIITAGGSLTLINSSITIGSEDVRGCSLKVYGNCIVKDSVINVNTHGESGVLSLEDKCTLIENSHIDCCKMLTLNYQICNSDIKTSNTAIPAFIDVPVLNSSINVVRGKVMPYNVCDKLVAKYQFTSLSEAHVTFVYNIPDPNPEKTKSMMSYCNLEREEQKIVLEGTATFDAIADNKIIMKHLKIDSMNLNTYSLNPLKKGTITNSKNLSANSTNIDTDIIDPSPIDIVHNTETISFANNGNVLGYFEYNSAKHELTPSEVKLFCTETNSAINNGKVYGKGSYDLRITDDKNNHQITSKTCVNFIDLICNK